MVMLIALSTSDLLRIVEDKSIPLFVIVIFNLFSMPLFFSLVLDFYGQIPWFRSFSIYNLVFSDKRMRLREENLEALVFLY